MTGQSLQKLHPPTRIYEEDRHPSFLSTPPFFVLLINVEIFFFFREFFTLVLALFFPISRPSYEAHAIHHPSTASAWLFPIACPPRPDLRRERSGFLFFFFFSTGGYLIMSFTRPFVFCGGGSPLTFRPRHQLVPTVIYVFPFFLVMSAVIARKSSIPPIHFFTETGESFGILNPLVDASTSALRLLRSRVISL